MEDGEPHEGLGKADRPVLDDVSAPFEGPGKTECPVPSDLPVPAGLTPEKAADYIRAIMTSTPGEIPARVLAEDFHSLLGYHIPWKQFGYSSYDSYLKNLTGIRARRLVDGTIGIQSLHSGNSRHLYSLLRNQGLADKRLEEKDLRQLEVRDCPYEDDSDHVNPAAPDISSTPRPISLSPNNPNDFTACAGRQEKPANCRYLGKNYDHNFNNRGRFRHNNNYELANRFGNRPESDWGVEADQRAERIKKMKEQEIEERNKPKQTKCERLIKQILEQQMHELAPTIREEVLDDRVQDATDKEHEQEDDHLAAIKAKKLAAAKYEIDCANFMDNVATKREYMLGKNFCELKNLAATLGLPCPAIRVGSASGKKYCEVRVGLFTLCGFPDARVCCKDYLEMLSFGALEIVAKLDLIIEKDYLKPVHFVNRLLEMIYARHNGIWLNAIEETYALKYNEQLPMNWHYSFLKHTKDVVVEVIPMIGDASHEVWKPLLVAPYLLELEPLKPAPTVAICGPNASSPQSMDRPVQRTRTMQLLREFAVSPVQPHCAESRAAVCAITQMQPVLPAPPALASQFPPPALAPMPPLNLQPRETYRISVELVTREANAAAFWARVSGPKYDKIYEDLTNELTAECLSQQHGALISTVGTCYALFVQGCWQRAILTSISDDNIATVFLVDTGLTDEVPFRVCLPLSLKMASIPALAVCCKLNGFDDFDTDSDYLECLHKQVATGTYMAEVISVKNGTVYVNMTSSDASNTIDINYNLALTLAKRIPPVRNMMEGQIYLGHNPHLVQTGGMMVFMDDPHRGLLGLMMKQLDFKFAQHMPINPTALVIVSKIYFARVINMEEPVYRVIVLKEPTPSGKVEVSLLDWGEQAFLNVNCIFELEGYYEPLSKLPPQGLLVNLSGLPQENFPERMTNEFRKHVPQSQPVLMKVIKKGTVPEVELFKRQKTSTTLVSVNKTLELDATLCGPPLWNAGLTEMNAVRCSMIDKIVDEEADGVSQCPFVPVVGLTTLPPAEVPSVGEQFDVHIPMVSNPNNFFVQPWNTYYMLQQMMFELKQLYGGPEAPIAIPPIEIILGRAYAALHPDGSWYRVRVASNLINEDSVLAIFSDYGDIQVLQLANIRPLASRFFQLPCQAIRANLYGVKPLHQDWCVQDCLAFQALVNERQFVSIVMSKPSDLDDSQDASISLKLIDTSGSEDLHIDQLLVREGKAEFILNGN